MPLLEINLTTEQAQKVSAAVKFMDGLANNATQSEIEAHYKRRMKKDFQEYERVAHKQSFTGTEFGN